MTPDHRDNPAHADHITMSGGGVYSLAAAIAPARGEDRAGGGAGGQAPGFGPF